MYPPFASKMQKLEEQRNRLFSDLRKLDSELLSQNPAEGGWSVAQVLRHLIQAETASLNYLNKKLQHHQGIQPSRFSDKIRAGLLNTWMALPLKAKAPKVLGEPQPGEDIEVVMKDYEAIRQRWTEALEGIPQEFQESQLFKHAIAGKMSLTDALHFFGNHFGHHEKQIGRILKSIQS